MGFELYYWLQWQVLLCAVIIIVPTVVSGVLIKRRRRNHSCTSDNLNSSSDDLWVPCWRNLHPKWLLFYRAVAFFSMAFFLYQTVLSFGFFVFFFYTQWTFVLVMIYFALATIVSARGCWSSSRMTDEKAKFLKKDLDTSSNHEETIDHKNNAICENVMQYIYQACAGAVILTDIVFWCLLLPFMSGEHFKLTLLLAGMHSINAFFLILDSALNSLTFPWFGIAYFVLWSCSYIVFQWTLHICCIAWWPYPFLDLSTPWAPLWYIALALFHVPCYGLYVYLIRGKEFIFSRMFPDAYITRISSGSWRNEKKQT